MRGMLNRYDFRRRWIRLGGRVSDKRRTGEEIYRHPLMVKPITVDKRERDAQPVLMKWLRRIEAFTLSTSA